MGADFVALRFMIVGAPRTPSAEVERAIGIAFCGARAAELAFSSLMVAADRRHYRRPGLEGALLVAATAESVWLAGCIRRHGGHGAALPRWIDTAFSAAGLVVCEAGLGEAGAPWMKNVVIGSALGAGAAVGVAESVGSMSLLAAAALAAGLRARGRDRHAAGLSLAVNDTLSWVGVHASSRLYVAAHRRFAVLRERAEAEAVSAARASSIDAERSRQQRRLHRVAIATLRQLAETSDLDSAGRLARQEAARLRHALRTGGEPPTPLDAALADAAESARAVGLHVELVTVQLQGANPGREVVDAVRESVQAALLASAEFSRVRRVVLRAAASDGTLRITIRDHGVGFEPGSARAYEGRLAALDEVLALVDGRVELWSEPGRGSRVMLSLPSGSERALKQAMQPAPDLRVRDGAALDDHRIVRDRDVEGSAPSWLAGAAQRHLASLHVGHRQVRGRGQPFESGAQQRDVCLDASARPNFHRLMMRDGASPVVGSSTPVDEPGRDELLRAERIVIAAMLTWRAAGLVTGFASVTGGWRRHRRPVLAAAHLAVAGAESWWLSRRLRRKSLWSDPTAAAVDAASAVALLVGARRNLDPADRWTWVDWTPWSLAANVVTGQAMGVGSLRRAAAGAAVVTAVSTTLSPSFADMIATTVGMAGFFVMGRVFAAQIRDGAARLVAAQAVAVAAQRTQAAEQERLAQLRILHDGAVQTFEAVGSGRHAGLAAVRAAAAAEADRLAARLAVHADPHDLSAAVHHVVGEARTAGMVVDLHAPLTAVLPPAVVDAICGAVAEALTNVRKHAGTSRATVVAVVDPTGAVVTVHDQGRGFERTSTTGGFGISQSIGQRLTDVGGSSAITSAPGAGTTVVLRWSP